MGTLAKGNLLVAMRMVLDGREKGRRWLQKNKMLTRYEEGGGLS